MGYTKTAIKGVSWNSLLRVSTRIITIIRLSILGRILTPTQFGFFGIATLLLSLMEILTETGINVFLVQEKGHISEYVDSAWVVSILRGIILALLIFLLAPFMVTFFKAPGAYQVLLLISVVPFIRGFINPAIITYQKDITFDKEFRLRFFLFLIDVVVSIIFGVITKSAVCFVYGLIASVLFEVLLSYIFIPIRPKLQFEFQKIKRIIKKGTWVTLNGIFLYFADNGDNLAVGRILGSASLGIYQIAYKFSTLPISEITNVVNQVVFPVYSKFSDDKERLWKALIKVSLLSSLGAIVFGGAIFIFSKPVILLFMGEQWITAVPVIQILAIYGILRTIFGNFPPLFLAIGRQDYVAQMTFFRVFGLLISVIPLIHAYGMVGAGYAMLFSMFVEMPVTLYFASKVFKKN